MKYEYGKEYETNGEKPHLPDDVLVEVKWMQGEIFGCKVTVGELMWSRMTGFRIVDERFKPKADESNWHERDKLVEQAIKTAGLASAECDATFAGALIDAGWRPIKQQTEEEFVDYAIECWEGALPTHQWQEMYQAGCRFIEQGE